MKPLPCTLSYIKVTDIISFTPTPQHHVILDSTTGWIDLPIYKGTLNVQTQKKPSDAGPTRTTSIAGTIKDKNYQIPAEHVILKVRYDDGSDFIIGTPDIPIRLFDTKEQYKDTIDIDYINSHPPLLVTE